jgi:hypothetical protein
MYDEHRALRLAVLDHVLSALHVEHEHHAYLISMLEGGSDAGSYLRAVVAAQQQDASTITPQVRPQIGRILSQFAYVQKSSVIATVAPPAPPPPRLRTIKRRANNSVAQFNVRASVAARARPSPRGV